MVETKLTLEIAVEKIIAESYYLICVMSKGRSKDDFLNTFTNGRWYWMTEIGNPSLVTNSLNFLKKRNYKNTKPRAAIWRFEGEDTWHVVINIRGVEHTDTINTISTEYMFRHVLRKAKNLAAVWQGNRKTEVSQRARDNYMQYKAAHPELKSRPRIQRVEINGQQFRLKIAAAR